MKKILAALKTTFDWQKLSENDRRSFVYITASGWETGGFLQISLIDFFELFCIYYISHNYANNDNDNDNDNNNNNNNNNNQFNYSFCGVTAKLQEWSKY